MADDMKRVGLIFKADGSVDFVKSLRTVNAELRENYQQFQLTQAQWDKNTKSSEKLADKLNYLNSSYDIQSKKVQTLKTELKELENSETRNETAIQQKKAALTQAEASLQRYGNQVKETSDKLKSGTADLEDFAKKLDKTAGKLTSAGKKASVFTAAYTAATGLAIKASVDFESSMAGVAKTFPGTEEDLSKVTKEIRNLAKVIPSTTTEISAVAEAAGQLGIQTDNLMSFTETMINLGVATNLSSEEAATTLARFANVTKMSQKDFDKLGSTIVELGNNFATTEAEISNMAMNLGSAGSQVGMSQSDILALATALSSVGLEAQAGGTAFSKAMIEMQLAVETGSDKLNDFAEVAGMTVNDFSIAFKEDATGALLSFIDGLSKSGEQGKSAIKVLDDMGITETRLRDALLRSANASDIFSEAIGVGSKAWKENNALTEEASKRYETTASKFKIVKNVATDVAISFGELLLPLVNKVLDSLEGLLNQISNLSDPMKMIILIIGGIVAAIGPLLIILGTLASSASSLIMFFTTYLVPVFGAVGGAISGLVVPITLIVGLIALFVAAIKDLWENNENFKNSLIKAWDAITGTLDNYWNTLIKPIFESFIEIIKMVWDEALEPLWKSFVELTGNIISEFALLWASIQPFVNWFIDTFGSVAVSLLTMLGRTFAEVFNVIVQVIQTFFSSASSIFGGLIKMFRGIIDFISGVFTGDWKKAWEGLKNIFKGIADSLWGIIKAPLNLIIAGINGLIGGLNIFISGLNKIKVPKWVPGIGGNGLNISTISKMPMLATGADNLQGAAIVGELGPELLFNKGGRSTVVPLTESGKHNATSIIDYEKLGFAVAKAMSKMKFSLDSEGFGRFVENIVVEAM